MRTLGRSAAAVASSLLLGACLAGPHQLRRSIDDWDHSMYVNSPLWNGALWLVPVIPIAQFGAWILDTLITDPWAFWTDDLWDGNGTGYRHLPVEWLDGHVDCLFADRASWTRVGK
jgi:hypothetical protein